MSTTATRVNLDTYASLLVVADEAIEEAANEHDRDIARAYFSGLTLAASALLGTTTKDIADRYRSAVQTHKYNAGGYPPGRAPASWYTGLRAQIALNLRNL